MLKRSINFLQKTWVLSREEGSALKLLPQSEKLFATSPLLRSCSPQLSPELSTHPSGCTLVALSPPLLLFPHHLSLPKGDDEAGQTLWEGGCLLDNQTHHPPGKGSSRGGNFIDNEKFVDNHRRGHNPHLHLPTFCINFWRQTRKNFTFPPAPAPAPGWSHAAKAGLAAVLPARACGR